MIILDDCSTDSSKEIIEEYRQHDKIKHIVYNEVNSGSTFKQWKKGVDLAKGELIWIAESDDVALPEFLGRLVPEFHDKNVSLTFCRSNFIDKSSNKIGNTLDVNNFDHFLERKVIIRGEEFTKKYMLGRNSIPNASAVVFRKSNWNLINDYSFLKQKISGDYNIWLNLLSFGKIVIVTKKMNFFRTHKFNVRSKTNNIETFLLETKINNKILKRVVPHLQPILKDKIVFSLLREITKTKKNNVFLIISFLFDQKIICLFLKTIIKRKNTFNI